MQGFISYAILIFYPFAIFISTFGKASPHATSTPLIIAGGTEQAAYLQYFFANSYTTEVILRILCFWFKKGQYERYTT